MSDYSICKFSIENETISPDGFAMEVYTLRATEYYYHYDLYQFTEKGEAEAVALWLKENLGIVFLQHNQE